MKNTSSGYYRRNLFLSTITIYVNVEVEFFIIIIYDISSRAARCGSVQEMKFCTKLKETACYIVNESVYRNWIKVQNVSEKRKVQDMLSWY